MSEGLNSDEWYNEPETGEFELIGGVVGYDGQGNEVLLTPQNTRIVLHDEHNQHYDYVMVDPGEGTEPGFMKLETELIDDLQASGCDVDRPEEPDTVAKTLFDIWMDDGLETILH